MRATEPLGAAPLLQYNLSGDDDVEMIALPARLDERLAGGDLDLLDDPRKQPQLLARQIGEWGDTTKQRCAFDQ